MELALRGLKSVDKKSILLVDGRDNYIFDVTHLSEPQYIIRGDGIVPQIMAASIVAKVTRDRIMIGYEDVFP
jgi:ribonuclease HII